MNEFPQQLDIVQYYVFDWHDESEYWWHEVTGPCSLGLNLVSSEVCCFPIDLFISTQVQCIQVQSPLHDSSSFSIKNHEDEGSCGEGLPWIKKLTHCISRNCSPTGHKICFLINCTFSFSQFLVKPSWKTGIILKFFFGCWPESWTWRKWNSELGKKLSFMFLLSVLLLILSQSI